MSKFQPLDFYRNQTAGYQLLPFRFERLGDDEVIVTNAAGELVYLTSKQLEAVVNHNLPVTDPDYALLRSRHFIREDGDTASVELLCQSAPNR
jgi:uncharacterized protein